MFHQADSLSNHRGPQHGHVDVLAGSGPVAVVQGGHDGEYGMERTADIAKSVLESQRPATLIPHRAVEAGQAQWTERRPAGPRSGPSCPVDDMDAMTMSGLIARSVS